MDSLSNFADSMAIAGPVILGLAVLAGAALWVAKAMGRRRPDG
jgi:hypothetical protein